MRLKVLPLDKWMKLKFRIEDTLSDYARVPARFKRPGIYCYGKKCWFEIADGRAFRYSYESFTMTLEMYNAARIGTRESSALKEMIHLGLANKDQIKLLRLSEWNKTARMNSLRARKRFLKFKHDKNKNNVN